jgi:hypothetical protein
MNESFVPVTQDPFVGWLGLNESFVPVTQDPFVGWLG